MFGLDGSISVGGSNSLINNMDTTGGAFSLFGSTWTQYAAALILVTVLIATGIVLFKLIFSSTKLAGHEKERELGKHMTKDNLMRVGVIILGTIIFWSLLITTFGLVL